MNKKNCLGCYDNDYNYGLGGSKECWSFESAKLENKYVIPVDLRPPYGEHLIKKIPSCYKKQKYCCVIEAAIKEDGYWA